MEKIFSVIICCYNSGNKIKDVIKRVVSQQYYDELVDKFILVNNNSVDNTLVLLNECKSLKNNIEVVSENKQGLSNARKRGVICTQSKWIIFLDDDNFIKENWLYNAFTFIDKNKKVGVFNGIIVPRLDDMNLDLDSKKRLESSLKALACTHIQITKCRKAKSPFRVPVGAGMVIRGEQLRKLAEIGWLNAKGRIGDALSSGEDSEMAHFIKKENYTFGFCNSMVLEHLIPLRRIDDTYLNNIWYELGKSTSLYVKKHGFIVNYLYNLLLCIRIISKYFMKNQYQLKYYKRFIKGYRDERKQ